MCSLRVVVFYVGCFNVSLMIKHPVLGERILNIQGLEGAQRLHILVLDALHGMGSSVCLRELQEHWCVLSFRDTIFFNSLRVDSTLSVVFGNSLVTKIQQNETNAFRLR